MLHRGIIGIASTMDPQSPEFDQMIRSFLATSKTATLATVAEDGSPCACNVQYAVDEAMQLYFVSSEKSLHSQNLVREHRVALTVYAHDDRAQNIHGLQIRGIAQALNKADECNKAWDVYIDKYNFAAAIPKFKQILENETFYRVTPHWVRWIDNRKSFGWKVEKQLLDQPLENHIGK